MIGDLTGGVSSVADSRQTSLSLDVTTRGHAHSRGLVVVCFQPFPDTSVGGAYVHANIDIASLPVAIQFYVMLSALVRSHDQICFLV